MAASPEIAPTGFAKIIEESNLLANASKEEVASPPSSSPPQDPPESPPPAPSESSPPAPPTSPTPAPPTSSPPPAAPPPPPEESPLAPPPSTPEPPQSPPPDDTASPPPPGNSSPPPSTIPSPPAQTNAPPRPGSPPAPVFSPPPAPRTSTSPAPPFPYLSPTGSQNSAPPNKSSGSSPGSLSGPGAPPPSDSNANTAIIAGIVVGGVVFLVLIAACLLLSKRGRKPSYYMDPAPPPTAGDQYYNASTQWNSPLMDQITKLGPPPGLMGTPVAGWGVPPPPPPANTSSDFSSGYSGQHPTPMQQPPSSPLMSGIGSKSRFTYEELAAATGGFSQANLLGQGGFGFVHKGILPDGTEVAVKSLKSGSGQGEREFQAEVEIISRVHHRHLVSLVGYCIAEGQRMLVYEFVPNKTLEFHLYGKGQPVMDWATRLRIAVGSAKGWLTCTKTATLGSFTVISKQQTFFWT